MIPQIAEFRPKPRKLALRCNVWQGRVIARTLRLVQIPAKSYRNDEEVTATN